MRLGREDEGLAELDQLRRLLTQDPDAVSYVSEALETAGHAEIAEQWLSAALETALARRERLTAEREDPALSGRRRQGVVARTRWPGLTRAYGSTWGEHRDMVQRGLQVGSQAGLTGLAVLTGRVEDLPGMPSRLVQTSLTCRCVRDMRRTCRAGRGLRDATSPAGAVRR